MKTKNIDSKWFFHRAVILVLLLFILISQTTNIKAQKLPSMLDTGSTDPSAFNIESIRELKKQYDAKVQGPSEAERIAARQLRNRLIGIGIDQIDALFFDKLKSDRKKIRLVQFILDFLEIGAATAISLTNGERAKSVISEGLGALQSSRTSLNKNFQLLERQILINKMEAGRATILAGILGKLDRDVVEYPWEMASSELRTYRDAGTLDSALSNLSAGVGKEKTDAEENLREVKDKPITSAATEEDRGLAESAANARSGLAADLAVDTKKVAALQKLQTIVEKLGENKDIADLLRARGLSPTTDDGMKILEVLRQMRTDLTILNRRDLVRKINQVTADVVTQ